MTQTATIEQATEVQMCVTCGVNPGTRNSYATRMSNYYWGKKPQECADCYKRQEEEAHMRYEEQRAREQEEARKKFEQFTALVTEVVSLLGDGWTLVKDERNNLDAVKDERELHFTDNDARYSRANEKGKITVRAWCADTLSKYDYRYGNEGGTREINVSKSKTAAQIAKDIQRRLLPDFEARYQKALENRAKTQEAASNAQTVAARLQEATGNKLEYPSQWNGDDSWKQKTTFDMYARDIKHIYKIEVSSGYGVTMEVRNMSPELAEKVLRLVVESEQESK